MEHTPGPWEIMDEGEPQVYIYGQNGTYIAEASSDAGLEEARTNAALIAAAPDLLEACQARVDEWHSNMRNFTRREPESLKLARAAITKAKGNVSTVIDEGKALAI